MFSDTFRRPDKGRLKGLNIGEGNRLKEYNGTEYTHDAPGNLIYRQLPNGENQYFVYDTENQLIGAEIKKPAGNTEIWEYAYDPFGRRLSKERKDKLAWVSTEPKRTHFVWDGTKLLQEYTYKGNYTYVYTDQDSYEPLAQVFLNAKDEQQYLAYFHTDQIGIPREMTDQFGNLLWYGEYTAWGKLASQTKVYPLVHQPFRLQNQYFDSETGLHYNFFRYYEPDTGRFVNQDPIRLWGGDNLYQFAQNTQSWVDLLGLAKARRPGGYRTHDMDSHGRLSPQENRAPGHCNTQQDSRVQSHHTIQQEWAKRHIKGYDPKKAPAILLPSLSGQAHAIISAMQRAFRKQHGYNTTIRQEFTEAARQLKAAGLTSKQVKRALSQSYKYFKELGAL